MVDISYYINLIVQPDMPSTFTCSHWKNGAFPCWYPPKHQTVIDYSWMPNEALLRQIGNDFIFISHFVMIRESVLFCVTIFISSVCFSHQFNEFGSMLHGIHVKTCLLRKIIYLGNCFAYIEKIVLYYV